jgi:[ribosomal protein S5]-alanine N-acetyltransferase
MQNRKRERVFPEFPLMLIPPTLTTERLVLRPLTLADADALFAACSNPRLTEYTLFETHQTREASVSFLTQYAFANYLQGAIDPLGVALRESPSQLVGCCGIMLTDSPFTRELGYWIAEPMWNRGYATEVVGELIRFAFEHDAQRVQARVIVGNTASVRVLEKAGFQHEGTMRSALYRRQQFWDLHLFAILNPRAYRTAG